MTKDFVLVNFAVIVVVVFIVGVHESAGAYVARIERIIPRLSRFTKHSVAMETV